MVNNILFIFYNFLAIDPYAIDFCSDPNVLKVLKILGMVITILKIIVPVILIIISVYKLSMVVIANEDIKNAVNNIFQKIIIGILIFFIPTIIGVIMSNVQAYKNTQSSFANCGICLTKATSNECKNTINKARETQKLLKQKKKELKEEKRTKNKEKNEQELKKVLDEAKSRAKLTGHPSRLQYPAAEASLMMALPNAALATGNYGTDIYTYIYDHVIRDESAYRRGQLREASNGSTRYRSCSEAVAVAVRWSGVDDNIPTNPAGQLNYFRSSSKWVQVPWNGDFSKLQPGDVFVDNGHSMMYVGEALIHKYFPNAPANYNITQASYNVDYINKARSLSIDYRGDLTSSRWINNVFRCIQKETNSKYANVIYTG